jgi:hypothetical protein
MLRQTNVHVFICVCLCIPVQLLDTTLRLLEVRPYDRVLPACSEDIIPWAEDVLVCVFCTHCEHASRCVCPCFDLGTQQYIQARSLREKLH